MLTAPLATTGRRQTCIARTVWLKHHWFDFLSIYCGFVVKQAVQQVVRQIESVEFESIQPTTIADTRRGAAYTAQWSIACEGHRRAGAIGVS